MDSLSYVVRFCKREKWRKRKGDKERLGMVVYIRKFSIMKLDEGGLGVRS